MKYDILIVGAGTSGMTCAIEAAQRGAKVGVLEKANHIGGALHWSGGQMSAGGTRRQKALGIADSTEKHLEDILRINEGTGDLDLIKMAVAEAPKTIDWLEDLGFEFAPECPRIIYGHVPYSLPRTHYGKEKAMSIFKVLKPLWDKQIEKGNIEIFLGHPMEGLRKNEGRFDEVVVSHQGKEKIFKGHNIVLTTGGYGSSPEYFAQKHPGISLVSSCYPTATGDGHQVAESAGGVFDWEKFHIPSLAGLEYPPGSGRCNFNEAWAMILTSTYRQPREIYVDTQGKRFMDEGEVNADTRERMVAQQPDWKFWLVFDEKALLERNEDGIENPIVIGWNTAKIKTEAQKEAAIFAAPTLDDLAEKTNLPKEQFLKTVEDFNQKIEAGEDQDFGRTYLKNKISTPPFYAILVHASVLVTFGGIKVNQDLQLIDQEGNVLEGLYGAGEFLGLGATSGKAFCSGMAITPALSFGRILGRQLAKAQRRKEF